MKSPKSVKGRGTAEQVPNRYSTLESESIDDGWHHEAEDPKVPTEYFADPSRTVISRNQSADVPFDRSVNPYKGCEHGCIYCFARPTHAYLDLSPGLDFESRIFYKAKASDLLRRELSRPDYACLPMGFGTNTDPWQPIERKLGISRSVLEVLDEFNHPVSIVTKSVGIERDIDILSRMAERGLVMVHVSMCTLKAELSRQLEPRAAAPGSKLRVIEKLREAGIPVGVLVAPVIPALNDEELEAILKAGRDAGAGFGHYIMLRLPLEVAPLFRNWLKEHYPLKAEHVMKRVHDLNSGRDYRSEYGARMQGSGIYAELIRQRFAITSKRLEYGSEPNLDCLAFRVPNQPEQTSLF